MTKIIDCTIRDGGHINNWNFNEKFVQNLYKTAIKSHVDYFEIGYRYREQNPQWGKFAHCDDNFIKTLIEVNENCKISVMLDIGKSFADDFCECKKELTPISLVRIATYANTLDDALIFCEKMKEKNYDVCLNLMAISNLSENDFEKLSNWKNKTILDSICFADSFGSFVPEDVEKFYNILKKLEFENISFHSHNNLQLAFANSIKALELDFYSIDASVLGLGRCAGILPIELILWYLSKQNNIYTPLYYLEFIEKYQKEIRNDQWGYDLTSLLSGFKNQHPRETSKLINNSYSVENIWFDKF